MYNMPFRPFIRILLFLLTAAPVVAQIDASKSKCGSYFFEGEFVVFEFDLRQYQQAMRESDSLKVDFADLGVAKVAISGNFNNKAADGWTMKKVAPYKYRLRKRLKYFKGKPNWQFRFVVNGTYWASGDSTLRKKGAIGWYDLKNPKATPKPVLSDTGKVVFHLKGHLTDQQVILTGSFNNWDENAIRMYRVADGWEMRMTLPPGEYEYKFIADGKWLDDPANPDKKRNQYDTYNSVLRLSVPARFVLQGYLDARVVTLAGSFNNWDPLNYKMQRTSTGWAFELPLQKGKHHYKFIVDGNWMTDPANPMVESDLVGNENSVLFLR
jgi:hypothetical protein